MNLFFGGMFLGLALALFGVCPYSEMHGYHKAQRYYLCYPNTVVDNYSSSTQDFVVCSDGVTRQIFYGK
jgi:hypothetical protein